MTKVSIRRQGRAQLEVSVVDGASRADPQAAPRRKRYRLDKLLVGATPDAMLELAEETTWVRDGAPVGREI